MTAVPSALAQRANAVLDRDRLFLSVEQPAVDSGRATIPAGKALFLEGWAVGVRAIAEVAIVIDGHLAGLAHLGIRREDVGDVFRGRPGSLLSGFAFSLPRASLGDGSHKVVVVARDSEGLTTSVSFDLAFEHSGGSQDWLGSQQDGMDRRAGQAVPDGSPTVVFWLAGRADASGFGRTLQSLEQQSSTAWRILVSPGSSLSGALSRWIGETGSGSDPRHLVHDPDRAGPLIDGAEDNGVWLWPLDVGDVLAADAVHEIRAAARNDAAIDLLYADERCLNVASGRVEHFAKPGWSPELLLGTNYLGHAWCARLDLLRSLGRGLGDPDRADRYGLALACTEKATRIGHVPSVLCERKTQPVALDSLSSLATLDEAAKRRSLGTRAVPGHLPGTFRLKPARQQTDSISVIIPTCGARGLVRRCVETLKSVSSYKRLELICVENIPDFDSAWKPWLRANADVVIEVLEPFNWSQFNNLGAREAGGSYLLFLNDDIEVIQPDWIETMLVLAAQPDIGVVGPRLLYPDGLVQHAGMSMLPDGTAHHDFRFCQPNDPGDFGLALTQRNVPCVTGACMMVRRSVFDRLAGFDEAHPIINNDVDFCLRARKLGFRTVYTPFAQLIHHELASRAELSDHHDPAALQALLSDLSGEHAAGVR